MNCKRAKQNLIFLAEGDLKPEFAAAIHKHLAQCTDCSHVYYEILQTLATADTRIHLKIDPWFAGRVVQQLINLKAEKQTKIPELKPAYRILKVIPVAASLLVALWVGILIGNELSSRYNTGFSSETETSEFYDALIAEDIYAGTFEAFFLTNGDN